MSYRLLKTTLLLLLTIAFLPRLAAQDTAYSAKHKAIFFPYPMYKEHWRSSIGFTMLTTPEDITEEVRLRIPCGDFRVMRKLTNHLALNGRIAFQFVQNHLSLGVHYLHPINDHFFLSAGDDMAYWFGFLNLEGFNSKASGWLNYPNVSIGFKARRDLLITLKAEVSFNLRYKAATGENKFESSNVYYNGEAFTLALEQPFYNRKHLSLAFSAINNYFNWQTWSLFYRTNRKVFYPQITVGFIL